MNAHYRTALGAAMLILMMVTVVGAEQRVITFETLPTTSCYDTWIESNCEMEAVIQTAADCYPVNPSCFIAEFSGGIYLTARLNISLATLTGIESVEIDLLEGWDIGCTRAFLYEGATQLDYDASDNTGAGMMVLDATGHLPDRLAISGHECAILEVRLIGADIIPTTGISWGTIKAIY